MSVVAIASPRIWSRIVVTNDTNDECIQEMLLRSQQAPLVVKVHAKINTPTTLRSVQAVLAEIHRICSMDLMLFGISLFSLTQSIECNLDALLLREFSMSDGPNTSRLSRETTPLLTGTIHLERQVLSGYNIEQFTFLASYNFPEHCVHRD
ncbi:hypothetical protein PHLCEN_2v3909 [Hermanssonia centrifuga]|uniref:Uncharacterized protein n=1 Tax=Hermanssonia centrifuga TaxID=98765 RepID=A0A2R6QBC1_9APHY|nr:hypothetical protein PHLCEN_2v3909 [Hermanssonia centrifuga]